MAGRLPRVRVDQPPVPFQEAPQALQSIQRGFCGRAHPPADVFGRELDLWTIGGQVVGSRRYRAEGTVLVPRENLVVLRLLQGQLYAKRSDRARSVEFEVRQEFLALPGIGLILQAVSGPSDQAVENARLLVVTVSWAKPGALQQLVLLLEFVFEPVQSGLCACSCEVITVNTAHSPLFLVVEHTRAGGARSEAEVNQRS